MKYTHWIVKLQRAPAELAMAAPSIGSPLYTVIKTETAGGESTESRIVRLMIGRPWRGHDFTRKMLGASARLPDMIVIG